MNLIVNLIYKLISLLDYVDYKYIHNKLLDGYKTIQEIPINNIEIETDTGYKSVSQIMISKPFEQYIVKLENDYELSCADKHIFFTEDYNEVFCEDLHVGDKIITDEGPKKIISITINYTKISMCDVSVDDANHRFYSNGILSHNSTTTAIHALWTILFNNDKIALVLSKSGPAGQDLIKKIKDMYMYLPYHLKLGTMKWNQSEISFDNNSSISTEAFGPTAGLGKTINFLILDEFAWCPANDVELFYNNIIPTVTTISNSNVCIMSTQNGFNLFYEIWKASIERRSVYAPFKVDWDQVPQYNTETKKWDKRDEAWHQMMVGVLGSEEKFQYQYGTQFASSDNCLVSREAIRRIHQTEVFFDTYADLEIYLNYKDNLKLNPNFNVEELKTGWFIILIDLAEGGGGDYTIFNILQFKGPKHIEQVGYWRSNSVDLEMAALEFWLLAAQLFNNERCLFSLEWNTYGALFYQYIMLLNETDNYTEFSYRFNYTSELEMSNFAQYPKTDDDVPGKVKSSRKTIPGVKLTHSKKMTGCALLSMLIEKDEVKICDIITISELENFEDKNGNGSYAATYGHDDIIMTFVQIPLLQQTSKYKNFAEDFEGLATAIINMQADSFNPFELYHQASDSVNPFMSNNEMPNTFFSGQLNRLNTL